MNELIEKIGGVIDLVLESASRTNELTPRKYWYPLAMATYGREEILEALDSMCHFRTTMWEKTRRFEEAFARFQGGGHAVMVNSGSSADLLLSLLMTNRRQPLLRPGDEVIVPAVTWPTQVWSPLMADLKVRLVDVDPETLNVDLDSIEVNPRSKALFLVHLMGNPCDMDAVASFAKKHDLLILEDCCEALGAEWAEKKVGTFGIGAAFSFFFSHHITTMEGGMVTVSDAGLANEVRVLRAHGWLRNVDGAGFTLPQDVDPRYGFVNWGLNVRPTELQAGFGLRQLMRLPGFTARREVLARRFFGWVEGTAALRSPTVCASAKPSWMALPLMVADGAPFTRVEITRYLEEAGVETRPIVAGNLVRQPATKLFPGLQAGPLPGADKVHERGFYVGLSPLTSDGEMDRLLDTLDRFVRSH